MSTATSRPGTRQIVAYVDEDLYQEFEQLKAQDRRLSFSYVAAKAIRNGWDSTVKELAPSFNPPTQVTRSPRRRR